MNRLPPHSGSGPETLRDDAERADISLVNGAILSKALEAESDGGGLRHRLFMPLHYERNYAYPLLIWLHNGGLDERQLVRVMPWISMRNYVAIGLRAPTDAADGSGAVWTPTADEAARVASGLFECIELVRERLHIAEDRLFVAGYGDGGEMALRIALDHPRRFAGAVSLNGPFPRSGTPLARLSCARRLPILLLQGETSIGYPLDHVCEDLRLFHAAGMTVTLRQYPVGDEIHCQMLKDLNVWIMERITGQDLFPGATYPLESSPRTRGADQSEN
ncbi:MAG: hypothetical protein FJ297_03090 [Planctomycetes bacterium]|nr:hypothetical protein [Planctomycetota bacterium]